MRYHYPSNDDVFCTPSALIAFAWSAPMRDLATQVGLSDVGLKKLLVGLGIPVPPQGYWNKRAAGKPVPTPPEAPPRGPGQHPLLRLQVRFAGLVEAAGELPPDGPFPSPIVPDDLEELRGQQLRQIGKVAASRDLQSPHAAIRPILARDEKYRLAKAADRLAWRNPEFDDPLNRRRLRLFNGLLAGLGRAGHRATVDARERDLDVAVWIGSTRVSVYCGLPVDRRSSQRYLATPEFGSLPASTKLRLTIGGDRHADGIETWHDTADVGLETLLSEIAAAIVVQGERDFRRGVREQHDARLSRLEHQEQERARRRAEANAQRLQQLRDLALKLEEATRLRALISQAKTALSGVTELSRSPEVLARWETWADAEADRIDPSRNGTLLAHVRSVVEE